MTRSRFVLSNPRPVGDEEWERFLYIESPADDDAYPLLFCGRRQCQMLYIAGVTDVGTVDFNCEVRPNTDPFSSGTDILTADIQAAVSPGIEKHSFATRTFRPFSTLFYAASAIASTPEKLLVTYVYARAR